jgi:hypothetical protein
MFFNHSDTLIVIIIFRLACLEDNLLGDGCQFFWRITVCITPGHSDKRVRAKLLPLLSPPHGPPTLFRLQPSSSQYFQLFFEPIIADRHSPLGIGPYFLQQLHIDMPGKKLAIVLVIDSLIHIIPSFIPDPALA